MPSELLCVWSFSRSAILRLLAILIEFRRMKHNIFPIKCVTHLTLQSETARKRKHPLFLCKLLIYVFSPSSGKWNRACWKLPIKKMSRATIHVWTPYPISINDGLQRVFQQKIKLMLFSTECKIIIVTSTQYKFYQDCIFEMHCIKLTTIGPDCLNSCEVIVFIWSKSSAFTCNLN